MPRRADTPERLLATVMFTDIVGSTELAGKLGDRDWRQLLSRHHSYVRKVLKRSGGKEIDTAGDGFFATFDQPARAIACARDLVAGLHAMGIEIRAGVHMGEVEVIGPKVGGIAVHIGSRVMSKARPGEVLVSSTVRDLMSGSDISFEDRGLQELKGVPAQWHLFSVDTGAARADLVEPVPEEREGLPRARTPVVLGAAAGVVAIAALTIVLLTRGGGTPAFTPGANTVARIDPASGKVEGGATVGNQPGALAVGQGSVWVANYGDRTVQRIDPKTGAAGSAFGGLNGNPTSMAIGGGFAWITTFQGGQLDEIDPATNLAKTIDIGSGYRDVAYGEGSVWVTNDVRSTVLRIDPATLTQRVIALPAGSAPKGIAVGGGSVWVADSAGTKVFRIDPRTNRLVGSGTPVIAGHPEEVAFGQAYVWVTDESADSVLRIDPTTGEGVSVEQVGNGPSAVAAGDEGVWVANGLAGTVAQIDPRTAKVVRTVHTGFSPGGIAVGGGAVWVAIDSG